ncbi:P2X purinoceptor [Fasciolopsis buskii]|uniref:P2X purinoceptor n=1 Tax=Fasciolopsis buskii TaxID=27845 RepID=A0A8E0VPX2_9TREM|nr:P2X purinoceptor [Fasciolopsis buski]
MGTRLSKMFTFKTVKYVQISNLKIGVTQRILQLIILIYIVCWVMVFEKGYQEHDLAKCTVTTKVRGVGHTNAKNIYEKGIRVWDVADFVIPPLENNAVFVTTNVVVTSKQKQGVCYETQPSFDNRCISDMECISNEVTRTINGIPTGRCVKAPGALQGQCEIRSWCPLENNTLPFGMERPTFPMVQNYTLLIKNDIIFEKFKVRRRNIQGWASKRFLRTCLYDKNHAEYKYCPIFKLSTIFEEARVDPKIFILGGVIGIDIRWDCDLDWNVRYCNPVYSFSRLDDPDTNIAVGFNFRYATYYQVNDVLHRDLIKAYGIRFVIHAHGRAGKFHIIPLTMRIGSGLALLGLAPMLCNLIVLNLLPSRAMYYRAKFEYIEEEQAKLASRRASRLAKSKKSLIKSGKCDTNTENGSQRKLKQSRSKLLFLRRKQVNTAPDREQTHSAATSSPVHNFPDLEKPKCINGDTTE